MIAARFQGKEITGGCSPKAQGDARRKKQRGENINGNRIKDRRNLESLIGTPYYYLK